MGRRLHAESSGRPLWAVDDARNESESKLKKFLTELVSSVALNVYCPGHESRE